MASPSSIQRSGFAIFLFDVSVWTERNRPWFIASYFPISFEPI